MIHINYYKSKGVSNVISSKILNDKTHCTLFVPGNKILTVKWTFSIAPLFRLNGATSFSVPWNNNEDNYKSQEKQKEER